MQLIIHFYSAEKLNSVIRDYPSKQWMIFHVF